MIGNWLPAAGIFDHCIAVVRFNGQTWWLDPTAGYQRGPLAMHYLPNYGYGLVISPNTTSLTSIPHMTGLPLTTTTEYFDLGKKHDAADLKVVTEAEGLDADDLRAMFANNKRSDIEKSYTHFYTGVYPGTKMTSPVEIEDNELQNRFRVTEFYTIDKAWIKSDRDGKYRCDFYPSTMTSLIKKPVDTQRRLPLAVNYPQNIKFCEQKSRCRQLGLMKRKNKSIVDPAFAFRKQSRRLGKTLVLEYEYQSLSDSVPPDRVEQYLRNLGEVSKCFGDSFIWR